MEAKIIQDIIFNLFMEEVFKQINIRENIIIIFLIAINAIYKIIKKCLSESLSKSGIHLITFYTLKSKVKNIKNVAIFNYKDQSIYEILRDSVGMVFNMFGIIIYMLAYYIVISAIKWSMDLDSTYHNVFFISCSMLILILGIPYLATKDFKDLKVKIVLFILLEDIYVLILLLNTISIKNIWIYIFAFFVSLLPYGIFLLYNFRINKEEKCQNSIYLKLKKINLIIVFIAGIFIFVNKNLFVNMLITAMLIISVEELIREYCDERNQFCIQIQTKDNKIFTTKESIALCNDGRLGIILEGGEVVFEDRDTIENITYDVKNGRCRNRKVEVTDSKGVRQYDDFCWLNNEYICFKEKNGDSKKQYKAYVYNVSKIRRIKKY